MNAYMDTYYRNDRLKQQRIADRRFILRVRLAKWTACIVAVGLIVWRIF